MRDRKGDGCRTVPGGTGEVGGRYPSLPHDAILNVLLCCRQRTKEVEQMVC